MLRVFPFALLTVLLGGCATTYPALRTQGLGDILVVVQPLGGRQATAAELIREGFEPYYNQTAFPYLPGEGNQARAYARRDVGVNRPDLAYVFSRTSTLLGEQPVRLVIALRSSGFPPAFLSPLDVAAVRGYVLAVAEAEGEDGRWRRIPLADDDAVRRAITSVLGEVGGIAALGITAPDGTVRPLATSAPPDGADG